MATRKTWIWIILACLGVIVLGLFAIAGAGVYFVASHIDTQAATSADAIRAFDDVRAKFKDQPPLFELDENGRPRATRPIREIPRSSMRARELTIMVWDVDDERIVSISLPFWLLRMGGGQINVDGDHGFRFDDLDLDVDHLERIGPALVLDYLGRNGERVLLWTQ
jgi:flagellar basal body-associated protein FliL